MYLHGEVNASTMFIFKCVQGMKQITLFTCIIQYMCTELLKSYFLFTNENISISNLEHHTPNQQIKFNMKRTVIHELYSTQGHDMIPDSCTILTVE